MSLARRNPRRAAAQTHFGRDSGERCGAHCDRVGIVNDWKPAIEDALKDFITVASLAQYPIRPDEITTNYLDAPHKPPSFLPPGKMAVYGFWHEGNWLKVGLVGPSSNARYTSQHYNPNSAPSTLAACLVKDARMSEFADFDAGTPGDWIKSRCNRVNILIDSKHGPLTRTVRGDAFRGHHKEGFQPKSLRIDSRRGPYLCQQWLRSI